MPASSLSLNFDAILSTTLFKWAKKLEDEVSTSNAFFYTIKKSDGGYQTVSDIGDRLAMPLMYELGSTDSYSGYDMLDVTPIDGITSAFFDWRQSATSITISGLEEKKNAGEERIIALLDSKAKQAEMSIKQHFNQRFLQGAGSSSIASASTSSVNGSSFVDPIAKLVAFDPTQSVSVGNINQSTNTWWRNQTSDITSTSTFAGLLKKLQNARNNCGKGPGGFPNLHICTQGTYELYEAALRSQNRFTSYQKADIPFDNIAFHGDPLTWDEYVGDAKNGTVTQTKGSWWMLNTKFFGVRVHADTNFSTTPFVRPENQDAKTAQILWLGAVAVTNRRKQGVVGGIDETISS